MLDSGEIFEKVCKHTLKWAGLRMFVFGFQAVVAFILYAFNFVTEAEAVKASSSIVELSGFVGISLSLSVFGCYDFAELRILIREAEFKRRVGPLLGLLALKSCRFVPMVVFSLAIYNATIGRENNLLRESIVLAVAAFLAATVGNGYLHYLKIKEERPEWWSSPSL